MFKFETPFRHPQVNTLEWESECMSTNIRAEIQARQTHTPAYIFTFPLWRFIIMVHIRENYL